MEDTTQRAAVTERAARAGGVVAREQFRTTLDVETKADKTDLVTATDRDAQAQILATIRNEFPEDTLVCEENALPPGTDPGVEIHKSAPASGPAWVVDPIDGTANFVRGMDFWTTVVAAVVDAKPVAAATYFPVSQDLYAAGAGGTTRNGVSVTVSDRTDPETFAVGLIGWWPAKRGDELASLFRVGSEQFGDLRRLGSLQGTLALVAGGALDAAFMPATPHPWDSLAGVHLVRAAGGTVTDVHGDSWDHDSEGLVVSNGLAHDTVVSTVETGLGIDDGT